METHPGKCASDERELHDQGKWRIDECGCRNERGCGDDDGRRAMPVFSLRRCARSAVRHGHLHGMQGDGERLTASADLSNGLQQWDGRGDRMSARFDVAVVGAGPGGMAAATVAAEARCRGCVLDDNAAPGGQIWRGLRRESAEKYPHGGDFIHWSSRFERSGCEVLQGWQVVDQAAPGVL